MLTVQMFIVDELTLGRMLSSVEIVWAERAPFQLRPKLILAISLHHICAGTAYYLEI